MEAPVRLRVLAILWPAFLMAGVLEMLVFAVVDPDALRWFGGALIGWTRLSVYSFTFLLFWGAVATAGALTRLLALTADEVNQPLDGTDRPPAGRGVPPS